MLRISILATAVLGVTTVASPIHALAQVPGSQMSLGKAEYTNHCAVCHGTSGKGDGPLAAVIEQKVADLSVLRKNNNGIFPFNRVYETIDGRKIVKAHGTRAMPTWGNVYDEQAMEKVGPYYLPGLSNDKTFIRGKILALIGYIDSLQTK